MAKKRYDDGGIVVMGNKPQNTMLDSSSYRLPVVSSRGLGMGPSASAGAVGRGGGLGAAQRLTPLTMPASAASRGTQVTPAVVTQPQSALGSIVGAVSPKGYGATGRFALAKGGKVKDSKPKKMASGGSTASKRGDGCATKGKTKGKFV